MTSSSVCAQHTDIYPTIVTTETGASFSHVSIFCPACKKEGFIRGSEYNVWAPDDACKTPEDMREKAIEFWNNIQRARYPEEKL